ncbi:MAG: hypothetical protein R3F60_06190 [bacterium]
MAAEAEAPAEGQDAGASDGSDEDVTFCVGPDWQRRERLPPTADACDPHADERHVAVYSGAAAIEAMRACTFAGVADRRPYTAILLPKDLLDERPAGELAWSVDIRSPGVEIWRHHYLVDGVTPCADLPMGQVPFGEGLTRAGESVEGVVRLRQGEAGRFEGVADLTFTLYSGEHGASALGTSAEVFGVETLW